MVHTNFLIETPPSIIFRDIFYKTHGQVDFAIQEGNNDQAAASKLQQMLNCFAIAPPTEYPNPTSASIQHTLLMILQRNDNVNRGRIPRVMLICPS